MLKDTEKKLHDRGKKVKKIGFFSSFYNYVRAPRFSSSFCFFLFFFFLLFLDLEHKAILSNYVVLFVFTERI